MSPVGGDCPQGIFIGVIKNFDFGLFIDKYINLLYNWNS